MGDWSIPQPSPWVSEFQDYLGRKIIITVTFNETTRALTNATVSRDDGCLWNNVVFDNPTDSKKAKLLPAPADGQPDVVYTAAQLARVGYSTIEQAMGVQITADR